MVEIYKKNFESYNCIKYKSSNSIDRAIMYNSEMNDPLTDDKVHSESVFVRSPLFLVDTNTQVKEDYIENYSNPLCEVSKRYFMIVIERKEDKLSFKIFDGYRHRQVGKPWFKINKNLNFITVNVRTGDVYVGNLNGYDKKKKCKKRLKRNFFLVEPLKSLKVMINSHLHSYDIKGYDIATEAIELFISQLELGSNFDNLSHNDKLFKFYLDKRGVKYPNNFPTYASELVGPEIRKILKKNGNKLVEAFMSLNKLSGKKVKTALHNCSKINLELYQNARELFGDDWLNQDGEVILDLLNMTTNSFRIPTGFKDLLTEEELKKVYKMFKHAFIFQNLDGYTFYDHMRMYTELRLFGDNDLKWYSENILKFREEHLDWSEKLQHYKKGTYTRHYPQYMYDEISKPLYVDFHPILLDTSSNYNEESSCQSNCVKGYIGKASSLIISVRAGKDLEERATIEYRLTMKDGLVHADRVQSLGKFNQKLEEHWTIVLLKLDKQVLSCIRDKRFETVKLTKECNNGIKLTSDTYWDEQGILRWSFKNIDSTQSMFINHIEF